MYIFLIPMLLGFVLNWASAFTTVYSRRWGLRGGQMASLLLRNVAGIPLWVVGFGFAFRTPSPEFIMPSLETEIPGWLLVAIGASIILWAIQELRWRAIMPSVQDMLARRGVYAHVRHPIYSGLILKFAGLVLLRPSQTAALACTLGIGWVVIQARLEELDLLQRMPDYREYMRRVPRFVPRFFREAIQLPRD